MSYDLAAHGLTVWGQQAEEIVSGDEQSKRSATDRFAATSHLVERMPGDDSSAQRTPGWRFWKR